MDGLIPIGVPSRATVQRYGDKLVVMPIPAVPFLAKENYRRETFGYPERGAAVVIASAGINFERRIEDRRYWDYVAGILRAYPQVIWQLVGINKDGEASILATCPQLKEFAESARLRFTEYETDLRAFLQCCDIYAHPPMAGASRSNELAAAAGLPILCYPYNDGAYFLPDTQLHATHDDYFAALGRLIEDQALRQRFGSVNSRILGDDFNSYAAQGLLYAVFRAMDRYNERQGLPLVPREDRDTFERRISQTSEAKN